MFIGTLKHKQKSPSGYWAFAIGVFHERFNEATMNEKFISYKNTYIKIKLLQLSPLITVFRIVLNTD